MIRNVTIPETICKGTPFQVQVEGENIDLYEWSFGDESYARGDAPWHTYGKDMPSVYFISVTGTNLASGCSITSSHQIVVNPDPLSNIRVEVAGIYGENCYGETSPYPFILLSDYNSDYRCEWLPPYGETGNFLPYELVFVFSFIVLVHCGNSALSRIFSVIIPFKILIPLISIS